MNMQTLSTQYQVHKLSEADIDDVLQLCQGNPLYYHYCPPVVTRESIAADMKALPPGKSKEDKYYLGYYDGDRLVAVLDLILRYPNEKTVYIGFFMVASEYQKKGIGTSIVEESLNCLSRNGYEFTRLGYVKGNPQPKAFWQKNGFTETGVDTETEDYTIVVLQREN